MNKPKQNDHSPESIPNHIAIIQLTRAGDLVQTFQAVQSIREENSSIRITLIARKYYTEPLFFLLQTVFDEIIIINTPELFKGSLKSAQNKIQDIVKKASKNTIDLLINLSFCKPSRYLSGLIPAVSILGPWIDRDNKVYISDPWSRFLYSSTTQGSLNPFHLLDLFKRIIWNTNKTSSIKNKLRKNKPWIVIHPFASTKRKRWKSHKWIEILYQLSKHHHDHIFFVVGAANENIMAKEIFNSPLLEGMNNLINLVGQTSLQDVYERLKVSQLFIGHDSLIGQLASVTATPTLTLALGSARPWETTPHGAHNVVLSPQSKCFPCLPQKKCPQYICHSDIPYQLVNNIASTLLSHKNLKEVFNKNLNPFLSGSSRIHLTVINQTSQLLDFEEIDPKPNTLPDMMRSFYRITWNFMIDEIEENRVFSTLSHETHAELLHTLEGLDYIIQLSEFGKKYSMEIVEEIAKSSPELAKIKETSNKIDEIDRLLNLIKGSHSTLAPIIDFYNLARANLEGNNIVEIAEQSFFCYQDSTLAASVMSELIQKTIEQHKSSKRIGAPTSSQR